MRPQRHHETQERHRPTLPTPKAYRGVNTSDRHAPVTVTQMMQTEITVTETDLKIANVGIVYATVFKQQNVSADARGAITAVVDKTVGQDHGRDLHVCAVFRCAPRGV